LHKNATDHVRNRMAKGTRRTSGGGMTQTSVSAESSDDDESEELSIDWRECAMKLQEENDMLKRQLLTMDVKVVALKAEMEGIRVTVFRAVADQ
jgi:hypothetical protein